MRTITFPWEAIGLVNKGFNYKKKSKYPKINRQDQRILYSGQYLKS